MHNAKTNKSMKIQETSGWVKNTTNFSTNSSVHITTTTTRRMPQSATTSSRVLAATTIEANGLQYDCSSEMYYNDYTNIYNMYVYKIYIIIAVSQNWDFQTCRLCCASPAVQTSWQGWSCHNQTSNTNLENQSLVQAKPVACPGIARSSRPETYNDTKCIHTSQFGASRCLTILEGAWSRNYANR